jgi:RNA polymerase sigma-70 factor (ECF subfamily)
MFIKREKDFLELYRTQYGGVRRTLQGLTGSSSVAEELTQEAFLKAWVGLPQFGFRSTLKTWVYRVALNLGYDWLRSHRNPPLDLGADVAEGVSPEARAVQEAILECSENERGVLLLHYYEGMLLQEIAEVLALPLGTVKSRLHAAKATLQKKLLQKGFEV